MAGLKVYVRITATVKGLAISELLTFGNMHLLPVEVGDDHIFFLTVIQL